MSFQPSWLEVLGIERRKLASSSGNLSQIIQHYPNHSRRDAVRQWRIGLQFVPCVTHDEIIAFNEVYAPFFAHVPEEAQTVDGFLGAVERNSDPDFRKTFGSFTEHFFMIQHLEASSPMGISNFGVYKEPFGEFDIGIYSIYIAVNEPYRGLGLISANRDFQIRTALESCKGSKDHIRLLILTEPNNPLKLTPATYAGDALNSTHAVTRMQSMSRAGLRKLDMDYLLCPLSEETGPCDFLDLRCAVVDAKRDANGQWAWSLRYPRSIAVHDLQEMYRRTQGTNVLQTLAPEDNAVFKRG